MQKRGPRLKEEKKKFTEICLSHLPPSYGLEDEHNFRYAITTLVNTATNFYFEVGCQNKHFNPPTYVSRCISVRLLMGI